MKAQKFDREKKQDLNLSFKRKTWYHKLKPWF